MAFLFVALGGAIGAMARYAISLIPVKTGVCGGFTTFSTFSLEATGKVTTEDIEAEQICNEEEK